MQNLTNIRKKGEYIPQSVHYSKRRYDGKFEVVAALKPKVHAELGVQCGNEVVLAVEENRNDALRTVKFLRGHLEAELAKKWNSQ